MANFNIIHGVISATAIFVVIQVGVSERSKYSGPFAYFHDASPNLAFHKGNKEIDAYFSQSRTVEESLSFLRNAQFDCIHNENSIGASTVSMAARPETIQFDPGVTHGSKVSCRYQFGGWLPFPKTWLVNVNFDGSGKSISVSPQRLAK